MGMTGFFYGEDSQKKGVEPKARPFTLKDTEGVAMQG